MPGASLLTLLDDIATVLDDVALLTKVAARKTAGVLGDDLALNAQSVAGIQADRELPVVWAVAVGSLRNKLILVPAALLLSVFLPWAVLPILMIGGIYLCFEGFEKLAHRFLHSAAEDEAHHAEQIRELADPTVDLVAVEKEKIRGAVRTDFILSAEIIVIAMGIVAASPLPVRVAVLSAVGLLMTVGVYGLVAAIVKLDDVGLHLSRKSGPLALLGFGLLRAAPVLVRFLAVAGTIAMFLVGGGIVVHGLGALHHAIDAAAATVESLPVLGRVAGALAPVVLNTLVGMLAGGLALVVVTAVRGVVRRAR